MQRHTNWVLLSTVACAAFALAAYQWFLPWVAAEAALHLPSSVGEALSKQSLKLLDAGILTASHIDSSRAAMLTSKLRLLRLPTGGHPDSAVLFRASQQLGANAFTLPDGAIVVTDELLTALKEDSQILAVLCHEIGHAHGRHGLQLLIQSSAVGAFMTFYLGDISTLLAAAPTVLLQTRYSRGLERQADDYGAAILAHNDLSPELLIDALEILAAEHPGLPAPIYLATHPPTDERLSHLRRLARQFDDGVRP